MFTVFFCHASEDTALATELAAFFIRAREILAFLEEGRLKPAESLIAKVEEGLTADAIVVLLSPESVPSRWVREEWEPVLLERPREEGIKVAYVLCRPCKFPDLLRRNNFFDLAENRLDGFRAIKRWLLSLGPQENVSFLLSRPPRFSGREAEMETLRRTLADSPGVIVCEGPAGEGKSTLALEFCRRCRHEFEQILWLNCEERGLAELACDLAAQVGFSLKRGLDETLRQLRELCSQHAFLIVLDEAEDRDIAELVPGGRCSVLMTTRRRDFAALMNATSLEIAGFTEVQALRQSLERTITSLDGQVQRLLAAMSVCAPGGFAFPFAAELAGLDDSSGRALLPDLLSMSLVSEVEQSREIYRLHPLVRRIVAAGDGWLRRHAQVARRVFSGWQADRSSCESALPDLWKAFRWAAAKKDDEEGWTLARELARLGFSFTRAHNRLLESYQFMEELAADAAGKCDRRALEECAWERAWILEEWGDSEGAEELHRKRRLFYADQMCFDFDPATRPLF